jgi:hypothetical protein
MLVADTNVLIQLFDDVVIRPGSSLGCPMISRTYS